MAYDWNQDLTNQRSSHDVAKAYVCASGLSFIAVIGAMIFFIAGIELSAEATPLAPQQISAMDWQLRN